MAVGGNIEAIRDWSNRFFYTKEEIADLFIKMDSGLTAYKLTFHAQGSTELIVTETSQVNPQSYTFTTSNDGTYTGLFFFEGDPAVITCSGETFTLNEYIKDIYLTN